MNDKKRLIKTGLPSFGGGKIIGEKRTKTVKHVRGAMDSWIALALREYYKERRPVWGKPRLLKNGFTPSSVGEPNDRLLVAKLLGYRGDPVGDKLQRIFDAGNDIEDRWIRRFDSLNVLHSHGGWLPNNVGSPLTFKGKYDIIIRHKYEKGRLFLVEVKSMSPRLYPSLPQVHPDPHVNFKNLMELRGQAGDWVRKYMNQTQIYLHEMNMNEGILLFDNKGTQEFSDFHLVKNIEMVNRVYDRLLGLQIYWERQVLPPWGGGISKSPIGSYKPSEEVPLEEMLEAYEGYIEEE